MSNRVLIVDDDANLLAGLRRQFRNGFDLHLAQGGAEALAQVASEGRSRLSWWTCGCREWTAFPCSASCSARHPTRYA